MRRWLKVLLAAVALTAVAALAFFFWPAGVDEIDETATAGMSEEELIAHGERVALEGDCVACHTVEEGDPYAGGLPFPLPFGTIYAPNITPHPTAGIGDWSLEELHRAMRHGVGQHGENLYPAFPYTAYTLMTDRDIVALYAYLQTIPASETVVQANELGFPFDQRWGIRAWNALFLDEGPYDPDPEQSDEWNRGRYLVEGAAHCGECHTPRNLFYALDSSEKLTGAVAQGWKAYNITSADTGIGSWTDEELFSYLHTGFAEGHGPASGTMAEAVEESLRHLPEEDIRAMMTYLRTVPALEADPQMAVESEPPLVLASQPFVPAALPEDEELVIGARIFRENCASCHAWDGSGRQSEYGALLGDQSVNDPEGTNVVQVILSGSSVTSQFGTEYMPPFGLGLSDTEVAAVANYVIRFFGDKPAAISPEDVAAARLEGHGAQVH